MALRVRLLILAVLVAVTLAVGGCTTVTSSGREEPTPTPIPPPPVPEKPTYVVRRGEVIDSLSFTGRVSPVLEEQLYFRAAGRVKHVTITRNEYVDEGQLLAELENDDLLRQLAQTEIELQTAETNLARAQETQEDSLITTQAQLEISRLQLQKMREALSGLDLDIQLAAMRLEAARQGPAPEDVELAQRNLEKAKNALWAAQASRDSTCGQPGAACDQAQATVQSREEDVRIQELNLQKVMAGPSDEDLLVLRSNYERAVQRRRDADMDITIKQQEIALAEQELDRMADSVDTQLQSAFERAKLSVERLQAQVENTQIFSPFDGKVTSVSATEGRDVNAYATVFVLSDEAELEVTADPTSNQLQRLAEGMRAELVLSRYPGEVLEAEIYQLPYPYGGGGGGTSTEDVDRRTRLTFDPRDLDLQPGDLVRVEITVEQKSDALWLAPAAIRTFAGRSFVVIEEDGVQRRVDVTLGIEGLDRVEILDGLEEGQVAVGQ